MVGTLGGGFAAVLFFFLFQVCGLCVSRLAFSKERAGARALLGSVCGSVMLQWFPVPFAFFLGFTPAAHLWAACLGSLLAGVCLWLAKKRDGASFLRESAAMLGPFRRRKFLWAVLALSLFFCCLVWRSFQFRDGKIFSSQATYGDMSMHLSFITSLARQGGFPPDYSLLPGTRLSYPFLGDSVSSSLYVLGASLKLSYFLPMALGGAQVFFGFYLLTSKMLDSWKKGALALVFFFFNGGFGFLYFLNGERSVSDLLWGFYQTPTNLTEKSVRWVNVVVDMMLPQRATLFGWEVLFPALYLLYRGVFEGERRCFLYAGILAGLLPMIHTHSFLAFALVCGTWLFCSAVRALSLESLAVRAGKLLVILGLPCMSLAHFLIRRRDNQDFLLWAACGFGAAFLLLMGVLLWKWVRRGGLRPLVSTWGVLLLSACVLALPQLLFWTFRQAGAGDFLRGNFGWVSGQGEDGYLWFYLKNIGLVGLLALGGLLSARSRDFEKLSPALAIWFLAELVQFQPNPYDNNKLLYPAFAFLCCGAAEFACQLLELLKSKKMRCAIGGAGLALCVVSAALTMAREWVSNYELFGEGAIALSDFVEENLPPDAVVLTDQRHNNEIAALSGRNVVCGSPAYLYYHGLPYEERERAVREMYENPGQSLGLFQGYQVDYVLVSDFERSSYQVDQETLEKLFPKAYDDGVRALYQIVGQEGNV